ncbi:MAG: ATP-binding protein [Clostridiales bacterium]|nr:ATP-binding protein [Clostridiales bacterium]
MKRVGTIQIKYMIAKNDFSKAGAAASNIKKTLRKLGISTDVIKRVAVAAYETEMNVIIHSHGGIMYLNIDVEKVTIIAEDKGPGIEDIEMAMKEGYSTATSQIRELGFGAGMGLPNIKRCADNFEIKSSLENSTIIKMSFNLK